MISKRIDPHNHVCMGITPFFREFGGGHHKNFYGFFTWDFFFWVASRVVSRISFFFLGGGSIFFPKKIFFPPGKNGLSRVFGCIPSFLDEASISPRKPHTPKLQNIMVV